ncbi:MAG: hypothetical protein R2852_05410 [Bacteroidia bacterium]
MKYTITYIVTCIILSSCCWESNSIVPKGYPFGGEWQELEIVEYYPKIKTGITFFHNPAYHYPIFNKTIRDSNACNKFFKALDSNYINPIDFAKYDLTSFSVKTHSNSVVDFQSRVLINHKKEKCILEVRALTKSCHLFGVSTTASNEFAYYAKYLLFPKLPQGYKFEAKIYAPAENT